MSCGYLDLEKNMKQMSAHNRHGSAAVIEAVVHSPCSSFSYYHHCCPSDSSLAFHPKHWMCCTYRVHALQCHHAPRVRCPWSTAQLGDGVWHVPDMWLSRCTAFFVHLCSSRCRWMHSMPHPGCCLLLLPSFKHKMSHGFGTCDGGKKYLKCEKMCCLHTSND